MTLEPGQSLLHYRIVDKLGEGGMGVVWRAVDTTLDREVAIKVLPVALAGDPERLARFEREAKLLASLSHPNIAAIYGIHQDDGRRFLAMELVEGEDLAQRLTPGSLPLDDVLDVAGQIAAAFEAAHGSGVIHRDLKPANVMLTPDGTVKVLDFGLAKSIDSGPASGDSPTLAPTATSAGSVVGMIMGTAAYMSPEQARGKPVDRQTDVWAFGCVLFELLTGRPAFGGETVTDVLTAILHTDPDWSALPRLRPGVERVLRGCLQKQTRERFRDMGDVGMLLRQGAAEGVDDDSGHERHTASSVPWRAIAVASLLALAALATAAGFGAFRTAPPPAPAAVSGMTLLTDLPGVQSSPALSSDAEQLLFVMEDGGDSDIFLQRVGGEKPINLTADYEDDDFQPAFSPDRRQIAFVSRREGGGVFVMGATGESPRRVSDDGFDPAWSPDGTRLVYTTERVRNPYRRAGRAQLWVVDLDTLERRLLVDGAGDGAGASWSPNGTRIAYWTHLANVEGQRDIVTVAADGSDPRAVTNDTATDWDPVWSPDGRALYFISDRGGSPDVWRVPVDEATGRVLGPMEQVTSGPSRVTSASVAADGRSVAIEVRRQTGQLVRMPFDPLRERIAGEPTTVATNTNPLRQLGVSADGEWLAYRTSAPRELLYVMRADGTGRRRLLDDEYRNRGPIWSPDGEWLMFYSNRTGSYQTWLIRVDGTGLSLLADVPAGWGGGWIDGGQGVLIRGVDDDERPTVVRVTFGEGGPDPSTMPLDAVAQPSPVSLNSFTLSPDDRFLVGAAVDDLGEGALALLDLETMTVEIPSRADGRSFRMGNNRPAWLDARRVAFWDGELRAMVIWDITRREARFVPDVPGPGELGFGPGGRTLFINRFPEESDVWMLTLAE